MPALATPMGKVVLLGQWSWPYLLLARFAADKAAPLGSPLAVDVGTLTIQDGDSRASQSGGRLALSGVTAAIFAVHGTAIFSRVAGRAVLWTVTTMPSAARPEVGWNVNLPSGNAAPTYGWDFQSNARFRAAVGTIDTVASVSAPVRAGVVLRASGAFWLLAQVGANAHTLHYVSNTTSGSVYAYLGAFAGDTLGGSFDDFRVLDLPAPWNSDYGIATDRKAGARVAGDSLAHTADCLLEFTVTTLPSAGVATSRGSSTGVANGNRVVVIPDGASIKTYVADVSKITYGSASNFATATTARIVSLGTGGAVSDLIAWPRTIALPSGV